MNAGRRNNPERRNVRQMWMKNKPSVRLFRPRARGKISAVKMATYSAELISFCTLLSFACLERSPSLPRLLSVALHHSPFTSSTHLILPHLFTLSHTILLAETDSSGLFPWHGQPGVLWCHLNSVGCLTHAHTLIAIHRRQTVRESKLILWVTSQLCGAGNAKRVCI